MASGKLLYHQEQDAFELNGIALSPAMRIEIHLMGSWMAGQLTKDATGWHVITSDHLDIGLRSGFVARFAHGPSSLLTKEQPHCPEFPKGEELKLILVVEDDEAHTSMLDQIFKQETPYYVYYASDGQLAWEILQDVKPNLIRYFAARGGPLRAPTTVSSISVEEIRGRDRSDLLSSV